MTPETLQKAYEALTAGHPDETLALLAQGPAVLPVLLLRGGALASLERHKEAVEAFEDVLRLEPGQLDAAYNLAVCQQALGRFHAARKNLSLVLEKQPNNLQAMLTLSAVLSEMRYEDECEALLKLAIKIAPDELRFQHNLAFLYYQRGRYDEAGEIAAKLLEGSPNQLMVIGLLGKVRMAQGQKQNDRALIEEAVALFDRGVGIEPQSEAMRLDQGHALNALADSERALPLFQQLAVEYPQNAGMHHGLGMALSNLGRLQEAQQSFERAVECDPEAAESQCQLSYVTMALGDFETGSRKYEWRWRIQKKPNWRPRDRPLWDGGPLERGRLLVWAEQGLGDQVMHFGWLRHLRELGVPFGVECDSRLVSLLERSFPDARVFPLNDLRLSDLANSEFVAQCPSGDLLLRTRPWTHKESAAARYLESDEQRREMYRQRLAKLHDGLKVGVSWYSVGSPLAFKKSVPLAEWQQILSTPDVLFVNLQYGDSEQEFEAVCRANKSKSYCDPDLDRKDDIEGLCALIDSLDLVISVSNVTAHFAGALGKPCWVVLGREPLWHWGREADTTPFHPSLETFRVGKPRGWAGALATVAKRLDGLSPEVAS